MPSTSVLTLPYFSGCHTPQEYEARITALPAHPRRLVETALQAEAREACQRRHASDPLRFARETCAHHLTLPVARLHEQLVMMTFGIDGGGRPGEGEGSESHSLSQECSLPCSTPPLSLPVSEKFPAEKIVNSSPQYVAIAAPRCFAKSTWISFFLPLWSVCQNCKHFIVLISNTHAQAVKFLQMIRYEFETNEALKRLYPLAPNKDKWSDQEIELLRGGKLAHKIVAMGAGAQLRGLRFLQYRPDLLILDDVENEELVDSEIRRADLKAWLDRTVLHVNAQAKVIVIGTILHEASLLNRLTRQHEDEDKRAYGHWTHRVFQAMEVDHSTWEAYQSTEALARLREQDPEAFSQEKQNQPVGIGYKSFDKPEFWTERRFRGDWPTELSISITLDPASTNREYSDDTAISVAGWDSQARLWVLEDEYAKFIDPDAIIDRLLAHYVRWTEHEKLYPTHRVYAIGIGKIAFKKYLEQQFKQVCRLRHLHPYVVELKEDRDKTRRIRELVPLFAQERIFFRPELTHLEQQLRAFPKGAHDDSADALAFHLQFGHLLPAAGETPSAEPQRMTFGEYVDVAEEWKRTRLRLAGLPGIDVHFVPSLWHN